MTAVVLYTVVGGYTVNELYVREYGRRCKRDFGKSYNIFAQNTYSSQVRQRAYTVVHRTV